MGRILGGRRGQAQGCDGGSGVFHSEAFELGGFYERVTAELEAKAASLQKEAQEERDQDAGPDVIQMAVKFDKRQYPPQITPKMCLLEWCRKEKLAQPVYETIQRPVDRLFRSTVIVSEHKYCSALWDKSKKLAEQAAAIVCLRSLGLPEGKLGDPQSPLMHKRKVEERELWKDTDDEETLPGEAPHKKPHLTLGTNNSSVLDRP